MIALLYHTCIVKLIDSLYFCATGPVSWKCPFDRFWHSHSSSPLLWVDAGSESINGFCIGYRSCRVSDSVLYITCDFNHSIIPDNVILYVY